MHMKLFAICLAGLVLGASGVRAQLARGTTGRAPREPVLQLREISGTGRRSMVRTPEYETDVGRRAGTPREWARILVEYESYPEWIDEVTFRYTVMALREEDGVNRYSVYKLNVRYVDVDAGRDHKSTVFLHPNAVERYGEVVAAAVEVLYEGNVVAQMSDTEINLPEDWWRNPTVLESDKVAVRDGYLMDRSQSPFALINIDEYEVIR